MAGYMTKLNGHVYEGSYPTGEELYNGMFTELDPSGNVVKTVGAKDTVMRVAEKTTLWGMPAVVLTVTGVGGAEVYFVESEWDINDVTMYDEARYATMPGTLTRMHRPTIGEQLIMSVDQSVYDMLYEGQSVSPAAGGTIS